MATIGVVTLAVVYWARSWWRTRKPFSAALLRSVIALDVGLIIGFFYESAASVLPVPALPQLLIHVTTVAGLYNTQVLCLHLGQSGETVVERTQPRRVAVAVAIAALVVLYMFGPLASGLRAITANDTGAPLVVPYLLVFELYAAWAMLDVIWTLRHAGRMTRRFLRLGLRLVSFGAAAGFLFVAHKAAQMVGKALGAPLPWPEYSNGVGVGTILAMTSALLMMMGITLPTLGSRWERRQADRQLEPLWAAVIGAVPDVLFTPPVGASPDRLLIRVTTIRDAVSGPLRPFLRRDIADRARELGELAGISREDADAAAHAAVIAAALRAYQRNEPPADLTNRVVISADGPDHVLRLAKIADAYTTSPIVSTITKENSFDEHDHAR
ncbi:hypothetical protein NLX83_13875 [Allokutzneria sp. A3M-2-11 16]|uniref:MAB_1171c family putative transporter n=1 Tax=Allokutzneria sp. A3M-2-11 16 TaxID=2962043 RepID=UPI0020B88D3A|nr:MAB_1171c family putative transporter [Allokutzneria sp. A3M-2-11 16]MCP3800348.1 hypothetical protein [Allokutzneria sp. A3M-2-11 16]